TFSDVTCTSTSGPGSIDRAQINGRLLFLALKLRDGTDLNGDGQVKGICNPATPFNPQNEEQTKLGFSGSVDIVDPGTGSDHEGELTFSELTSSSLTQVVQPTLSGGAVFRADAVVDFSTLGADLGRILPAIKTRILVDFSFSWDTTHGFQLLSPQVVLADITLDLGSFISDFAKPILDDIAKVLDPLKWLIGPDGFLNKRIPLLSDLAGKTITGKDLIIFFDPDDGPKIVGFLNFVLELYRLIDMVNAAASEGHVGINFGDLILVGGDHTMSGLGTPKTANPALWNFIDHP